MSIDIIKSIKKSESEAEEIKKQSFDDSRQILSEASSQSYKLMEQIVEDAEKEGKQIIKEAERLAGIEVQKLRDEVATECETIKTHGRKNLDKAVEIIIGRIVSFYGNS